MMILIYMMSHEITCIEVNGEALQVHTVDVFFTTSIVRAHICTTIKLHDTYLVLLVTYAVTLPSSVETILGVVQVMCEIYAVHPGTCCLIALLQTFRFHFGWQPQILQGFSGSCTSSKCKVHLCT